MVMTFDDVIEIIWGDTLGIDASGEYGKYDFLIKCDGVATGREALNFLIRELKDTYMPTIEMTQTQYNFLVGSDGLVDVIGNISVDGIVKEYFDEGFWKPLDERDVAKAWFHPETIEVVDDERN